MVNACDTFTLTSGILNRYMSLMCTDTENQTHKMYCAQKRKGFINLFYKYKKASNKNVYIYLEVVNISPCMSVRLSQKVIIHYSAEHCINTEQNFHGPKHVRQKIIPGHKQKPKDNS